MIALKRYISNLFKDFDIWDMDNELVLDINKNNIFDSGSIDFQLDTKYIIGDIVVSEENLNNIIKKFLSNGIEIEEIHNHYNFRHIHIFSALLKENIDLLAEVIK